ncbi:hypothetical protein [Tengunoibacter tsumagoiensis]|uniref:Butirosin biosynthesis protein H N-terminal domain-containing protein n=1 Tax=Tengunoibacter tsumagoiensis TaxID=2014871 RepID=A0A401ZZR7_9CHLR|nr:hypothetical protein [Tengunoibacter tsumagoiensis]GCE12377.1 hypothetical protein KTT_22360 [Tengunoibacter tsumagoiensis]
MPQLTVYTNAFHNCRGITLSAMLLRLGVPIDYVWHQAGLIYQEEEKTLKIDPYYQDITENDHGVKWMIEHDTDLESYVKRLYDILQSGHTIALMIDTYYLPYSIYYERVHHPHTVEACAIEDGHVIIADHPYQFYGPVALHDLKKSLDSYYTTLLPGPYGLLYAEAINVPRTYTREDLYQAIADNCAVMETKRLYDLRHAPPTAKIGMDAVNATLQKVEEIMQQDLAVVEEELDTIFGALKEIANSRHFFYKYLTLFQEEALATVIQETSQNWIVASHLVLRGKAVGDLPIMWPRVKKRLVVAKEKELNNIQLLHDFLASRP